MYRYRDFLAIAITLLSILLVSADALPSQTKPDVKYFTLMYTNDEHSALLPAPDGKGGFARLASAIQQVRTHKAIQGEPTMLVSAGDFWGGAPFGWLGMIGRSPELSLMQLLGYDAVTLGNHEFDCGSTTLRQYLSSAGYPKAARRTAIVATNTHLEAVGLSELGICNSHLLHLANGIRVGVVGLIGERAAMVAPKAPPASFNDLVTNARQQVQALSKAGAEIILALSHSGLAADKALAKQVQGIDIIVGGHCHTALKTPLKVKNTLIVQAGKNLEYLGVLELAYFPHTGELKLRKTDCLIELDAAIAPDAYYTRLIQKYQAELEAVVFRLTQGSCRSLEQAIAYSTFTIWNLPPHSETPLGNLLADAIRHSAERAIGKRVDFAFLASGLIRGSLKPRNGQIILHDVLRLVGNGQGPDGQPGYPLVSVYLTGEEIFRVLELSALLSHSAGPAAFVHVSGLRCYFDPSRSLLLRFPLGDMPVPLLQAVQRIEVPDQDGHYRVLSRTDKRLYHVVTDLRRADYLPLLTQHLPWFAVVPKDAKGNPVQMRQRIIYREGRELKVWQALLEHLHTEKPGAPAVIASVYSKTQGRLVEVTLPPLYIHYLLAIVGGIIATKWWRT